MPPHGRVEIVDALGCHPVANDVVGLHCIAHKVHHIGLGGSCRKRAHGYGQQIGRNMGGDLLLLFFVLTVGAVFQVVGAVCVPSPYSNVGAQRELLLMLAYEPILILVFVGFAMCTGSFSIAAVFQLEQPLLLKMPLLFLALGYALTIKLRKSPFDIAACHHGHQELVRGVQTEYSGPYLALIEIAHWFDLVLILGLCAMFWHTSFVGMAVLVGASLFTEILIDNITARLTWQWMVQKKSLLLGMGLALVNLLWLYVA